MPTPQGYFHPGRLAVVIVVAVILGIAVIASLTPDGGGEDVPPGRPASPLRDITTPQDSQPSGSGTAFGDGIYVVGADIQPGTYRTDGPPSDYMCVWFRLSGFGGSQDEWIEPGTSKGPAVVTINPSDAGFQTDDCGTWTRID